MIKSTAWAKFHQHAVLPYGDTSYAGSIHDKAYVPCAKVLGRPIIAKAWRLNSIVNISAMSYGSLSQMPRVLE